MARFAGTYSRQLASLSLVEFRTFALIAPNGVHANGSVLAWSLFLALVNVFLAAAATPAWVTVAEVAAEDVPAVAMSAAECGIARADIVQLLAV